jgi:hypothetical protein
MAAKQENALRAIAVMPCDYEIHAFAGTSPRQSVTTPI